MKIGIVGLPNVGKSTIFNALTKSYSADVGNFPFCTIEPNVGIVDVKDSRVDKLAEISKSQKKVYANIKFVDIAGLVKGAGKGEGLGNKFLSNIREVDAIVHVLRYFKNDDVGHVEGRIDPLEDAQIINYELIFADLQLIEPKLSGLEKRARLANDKEAKKQYETLKKAFDILKQDKFLYEFAENFTEEEKKVLKNYNFLTFKPIVYAFNIGEEDLHEFKNIETTFSAKLSAPVVAICGKLEQELLEMEDDEKLEFLKEMFPHVENFPTLDRLIKKAFDTVGLMYYFTTGEKETKAWTIKKGFTAPQAAGVIHSDFERGFIKAEIVSYDDLVSAGSRSEAKKKGLVRLEGKDYVVQDGDVIIFRFNV